MTAASHERTLQQLHQHRSIFSLFTGSHFSRNRLQISSPFTGLRSLVIIWTARFFACIINNESCFTRFFRVSFIPGKDNSTNGLASTLTSLRVPLGAFHQPQASLVRGQYLEVNWFSCFFLGILEFVPLVLHRLPFVDRSGDPADDQSTEQVPPSYNSDAAAPEYQEALWSVTQRTAPLPCADV